MRENAKKREYLASWDRYHLLKESAKNAAPQSIEELMQDDEFDLLASSDLDIFTLRHVSKPVERSVRTHDFVGQHTKCEDFEQFEDMFKRCHEDLAQQKRLLKSFSSETSVKQNSFYVQNGVLLYVDNVGDTEARNQRKQARLRCIYENGTESNILSRSLAKSLFRDGKIVTENADKLLCDFATVREEDEATGHIYVLKSLSRDTQVKNIKDLYKIGYCKTSIQDRIKNAINEPTYLMAKVKLLSSYAMYNVNSQKFEALLHRFFSSACVAIDVCDHDGMRHSPREWFQAPFEIIQQAIILLQTGEIIHYKYSRELRTIVEDSNESPEQEG